MNSTLLYTRKPKQISVFTLTKLMNHESILTITVHGFKNLSLDLDWLC